MDTAATDGRIRGAASQAFLVLRVGFTAAPILFGIDKFFNWTVHWPDYLAGWIDSIMPGSAQDFMYFVGAAEILAGLVVAGAPGIGGPPLPGGVAGGLVQLLAHDAPPLYGPPP